jgi:hypothetical protein
MATLPTNQITILFADIAGSTRLYDTFGDFKARGADFGLLCPCLKELVRENEGNRHQNHWRRSDVHLFNAQPGGRNCQADA